MTDKLLNFADAPNDPVARAMWLTGVMKAAKRELELELAKVYYDARLQGVARFEATVRNGPLARSTALALTRQENNRRGRPTRWGDGLDSTSSAYSG